MRRSYASLGHAWIQVEPNLWSCAYCPGWFVCVGEPNSEAIAINELQARLEIDETSIPTQISHANP